MSKLITMVELHDLKSTAQSIYDHEQGDEKIAEFKVRIDKGNRYLAGLRDMDPKPKEKIEAAVERLDGIVKELRDFVVKYELPLAVYRALYDLACITTSQNVGLTRCVPGDASGLHNAIQIRMEDLKIDLLLDLSYDGVPF